MRLLWLAALGFTIQAHTYHSSIAQLDYISARQTIECIVWLHTEDIERAFQQKRPGNFDDPKQAEAFVRDYLREYFQLRNSAGQLLAHKWVGLEVKVHFVAAYFEIEAPSLQGLTLANRLLLDRVPDQTNTAQWKVNGKPRKEAQFDRRNPGPVPLT